MKENVDTIENKSKSKESKKKFHRQIKNEEKKSPKRCVQRTSNENKN